MIYPNQSRFNSHLPWVMFTSALFFACFILSVLIPPLQSPDEGAHIERIYMLSKGQLMLETPEGSSSGGMIDSGLRAYLQKYNRLSKTDLRMSQEEVDEANNLRWTGEKEFDVPTGTGYYFPLIYTPQALGLGIGEALGFTIDTSYRMARFFVLLSTALVLAWAFIIHRPPIIAAALLILPMSLFQFSSASLDGISTAIFILAVSCFSKIALEKKQTPQYISYLLIASVFIVTSSRAHALPLFALVFASYFYTRDKRPLAASVLSFVFVMIWLMTTIKLTKNLTFQGAPSASTIALYYLKDPLSLAKVIYVTLAETSTLESYLKSFIGVLGRLDTPLPNPVYNVICAAGIFILALSAIVDSMKGMLTYRLLMIACSIGAILLTFTALLIQWNSLQHPATIIQGIQGRYFLIPALLLAYAVGAGKKLERSAISLFCFLVLTCFLLYSTYSTSSALISRYLLVDSQPPTTLVKIVPSPPLSTSESINLNLEKTLMNKPLRSVSVSFATYKRVNQGDASLSMTTNDGKILSFDLDLASLKDNQYYNIPIDEQLYSAGEIIAKTGGGVSVWQAEVESGGVRACVIYEYSSGAKKYTKGCPR